MHGTGHADDLVGLQMPGNKADAVPCERLPEVYPIVGNDAASGKGQKVLFFGFGILPFIYDNTQGFIVRAEEFLIRAVTAWPRIATK